MERLKITLPIIVEGRYDKSTLSGFLDATIITTGGFSIFNNKEKQALLKRLSKDGVILLTDSDGGGKHIDNPRLECFGTTMGSNSPFLSRGTDIIDSPCMV